VPAASCTLRQYSGRQKRPANTGEAIADDAQPLPSLKHTNIQSSTPPEASYPRSPRFRCRLQYHVALGVSRLYVLYDGADPSVTTLLALLPRVEVMLAGGPLAEASEVQDFQSYLAAHDNNDGWRGRPGNYELMVKQGEPAWPGL
jgi:hypothetical protein